MAEFEVDGRFYKTGNMPLMVELHVLRRILPLVAAIDPEADIIDQFFGSIGDLEDTDYDYVKNACRRTVSYKNEAGAWVPLLKKQGAREALATPDINVASDMKILAAVLMERFSSLLSGDFLSGSRFEYRAGKWSVDEAAHVIRRVLPIYNSLQKLPTDDGLPKLRPLLAVVGSMRDRDVEYVIEKCLDVAQRRQPQGTGWAPVWNAEVRMPMFSDINSVEALRIAQVAITENASGFFSRSPLAFERRGASTISYDQVSLPDGRDWLMRPVLRGMCSYESLKVRGLLSLEDIAEMNDALDVLDENEFRAHAAMKKT